MVGVLNVLTTSQASHAVANQDDFLCAVGIQHFLDSHSHGSALFVYGCLIAPVTINKIILVIGMQKPQEVQLKFTT